MSTKKIIFISQGFLALTALIAFVVAIQPELRTRLRAQFEGPSRIVLSSVDGHLRDGTAIKVVKIKTHNGLFLEIYNKSQSGHFPLMGSIPLPDHKDGFFLYQGEATNLALEDVDGDQQLDIIAPSYDNNLVARLNVYSYDQRSGEFVQIKK